MENSMRRLLLLCWVVLAGCNAAPPATATTQPTPTPTPATQISIPTATPQKKTGGAADHVLGPDNAFLMITFYGDFQCLPCLGIARTLAILRERYPADVRVVWRHFPQPENNKARLAAQASEAASAQGKFWEMHDHLFISQPDWTK